MSKGVEVKHGRWPFSAPAAVAAALLILGAGCPKSEEPAGPVLVEVGTDRLTRQDLAALAPEGFTVTRENLPKILDKWVSNSLMYQEAVRRGLKEDPKVRVYLQRLERDYLVNELLRKLTESVSASQAEMLEYFNAHRDEFPDEVKIVRIVLPDSLMAVRTLEEIRQGGDFQKLARERSQDQLLPAGQESSFLPRGFGDPRGGGDPALEEAIFALKKGEVSDVVASQEGYQLIKLVDRRKVKPDLSFAETQGYIQAVLAYRKGEAAVDSILSELRGKTRIELRPDAYFE
jgi:parvulin-like peptidyl-prolyl isomerase